MNVHKIPNITINRLTSIAKKFLWNATSQSNKKSPINWKTLTYHKSRGGLRIRNLIILNKAYIMKNTWRLINDKNSLWAKVMKGKYFPKTDLYNSTQPKPYHSCIWKNIYKLSSFLKEATFWSLGNGKSINVWRDKWVDNFRIDEYINQVPTHLSTLKVAALINWTNKSWNLEFLKPFCPEFIINKIVAIPIPSFKCRDQPHGLLRNLEFSPLKVLIIGFSIKISLVTAHLFHGNKFGNFKFVLVLNFLCGN